MSRIAKNPIKISKEIECTFKDGVFSAKGKLGQMETLVNSNYTINIEEDEIKVLPLKEITNDKPKPLYPIYGKSTIERCISEISNYSKTNVLITLGYKSELFNDLIKNLESKYKINIDIFVEDEPLGECGALWVVKNNLSENFIFINGDLIFSIDFKKLVFFHKRLASNLTLVTHTSDHPEDSDLISAANGTLIDQIFVKSSQKNIDRNAYLGNSGIFVLNKNILDDLYGRSKKR